MVKPATSLHRAVFLDRDGVLSEEGGLIAQPELIKTLPGAAEALKLLKSEGFKTIVVTNQPVVARGLCTEDDVKKINLKLIESLGGEKLVDGVYFCPHHPEKCHIDIPQSAMRYRIDCECRKPKPGMLLQASKENGIDLASSFMIGDSTRDILAAKAAGCKSVLVETGYAGKDGKYEAKPDAVAKNVLAAAQMIAKAASMPAVILAGGRGERMRPLTDTLPKPMLPVAGKPVIEWQLELLRRHGVKKVVICGHYLLDKIADYFGNGSRLGISIEYVDDGPEPLGSGGALKNLEGKVVSDFIVLSSDVMTTLDISALALAHASSEALATIVVRETDHPHDSDIVQVGADKKAVRFFPKKETEKVGNLGVTGASVLNSAVFKSIKNVPCNLEGDILADMIKRGENIRCHLSADYIRDMGTPERYERVQKDFTMITNEASNKSTSVASNS